MVVIATRATSTTNIAALATDYNHCTSFIAMRMPDSEYSVATKIWVLLKPPFYTTAVLLMFKEQSGNSLIDKFKRQKLNKRSQESVDM